MSAICRDCLTPIIGGAVRCPHCASPRILSHAELNHLAIAHIDCDAFYASVEKRDRPELRDRPVIVGGQVRGVVTTACYIARQSGVRSAMPMFQARRLCPEAVIVAPDFRKYRDVSRQIFDKVRTLTPFVQSLSLDEAWVDLAGTERLHGVSHALTLAKLQRDIERDVGVTVSIGLASNRFLAKIASDLDKPRGFAVIGAAEAAAFLAQRPVSILPGVGQAFVRSLEAAGFRTVGDLAARDQTELVRRFGVQGGRLAQLARGEDSRRVNPDEDRKSISAETTFAADLSGLEELEDRLWPLCDKVARVARSSGLAGAVVTLKLKRADFRILTRRKALVAPTQTTRTLFRVSRLLLAAEVDGRRYRLIGVGLSGFSVAVGDEGDFFPSSESRALRNERVADGLRDRFGAQVMTSARQLRNQTRRRKSESPGGT